MSRTVDILLFDDFEVLDPAGPFEVFAVNGTLPGGIDMALHVVSRLLGKATAEQTALTCKMKGRPWQSTFRRNS